MESPVSVVVLDMYMKEMEKEAMDTAAQYTRPSMWKQYIDDSFKVVRRDKRDELTKHLNSINTTGSIKFKDEPDTRGSIPFLDALIFHNKGGKVKVQAYCKANNTDQYLTTHSTTS